jgi:two-component system nitrogen regulation sensor histidine kinase NtrY
MPHERRVLLLALAAGLPAVLAVAGLLWLEPHDAKTRWTLLVIVVGAWLGFAFAARERVIRPLQTLANMIAALREGDYSIRARHATLDDSLALAYREVNTFSQTLHEHRLTEMEATALLARVMETIDVAVYTFDAERRLRLVNRAGTRLLRRPEEYLIGRDAVSLGLDEALNGPSQRVVDLALPGGNGRWEVRRGSFRQGGLPHELLVLADVSRVLRDEERQAWQRIVRVLSHEVNNSLAPIKSIADTLQTRVGRTERSAELDEDLRNGLGIVASRADALGRFMASYARLARLPKPRFAPLEVEPWVRRVCALETRLPVTAVIGPSVTIQADQDQLDQLLINLVRNAVDASLETGGGVRVGWQRTDGEVELWIEDDGPGLGSTENLFVPFYTTKPGGSGVGLALSRQIAEGHGGTLTLENRSDARGCRASLRLRNAL